MAFQKKSEQRVLAVAPIEAGEAKVYLLGTTPLYMNRMSKKAREQLLLPPRTSNKAARETVQKHNPPEEYREAIYRCRDDEAPTLIHIPDGAIKGAMAQTALRTPGATKTEIGCLAKVLDPTVHLYGTPYLKMDIVRQGGMTRTPDVRTRAFFPEWACSFTVWYVRGFIREQDIINLLGRAGMINGIGDGRTEKGKFDFGSWELVDQNNKKWNEIVNKQARDEQTEAMENPVAFDPETEELLAWYHMEIKRREVEPRKSLTVVEAVEKDQGGDRRLGRGRRAQEKASRRSMKKAA